jgi:hypothetical protein
MQVVSSAVAGILLTLLLAAPVHAAKIGRVTDTAASLPVGPGVPLPDHWTVREAGCPGRDDVVACANVDSAEVFVAGADAFERWHELGHLFDYQRLTDTDRGRLTPLLGFRPGAPWWSTEEDDQPGEFFADAYAACALRLSPRGYRRGRALILDWQTAYGYFPTARRHARVCAVIRAA